jgi:sortase B
MWDTWQIYNNAGSNALLKYKPTLDGNTMSLSELVALNSDVCAWITVDDTGIDYPVAQGETNFTYVNQTVLGEFSLTGSIFLDYRNSRDFTDFYSLLYGHHMDISAMFGDLTHFIQKEYFNSHKTGTLYLTDGTTFEIKWFAAVHTDAYDVSAFNPTGYESTESRNTLLSYLKDNAVQYRDLKVSADDQIIGLSTCYDATTNVRVLLFGKMTKVQ